MPKTFICKHTLVPNFVAEFYQNDNALDVKFFRTDRGRSPLAYKLDSAACKMLIDRPPRSWRVAFVFDVGMKSTDYGESGPVCDWDYTGNAVFTMSKNKIVNRLVLISDEEIQGL